MDKAWIDQPGERERLLDPVDRISEVLFGLIMAVTIVGSLSVATAGRGEVRAVVAAALGCNRGPANGADGKPERHSVRARAHPPSAFTDAIKTTPSKAIASPVTRGRLCPA